MGSRGEDGRGCVGVTPSPAGTAGRGAPPASIRDGTFGRNCNTGLRGLAGEHRLLKMMQLQQRRPAHSWHRATGEPKPRGL